MIRRGHSFFQMYGNDFVFSNYIKVQFSIRSKYNDQGVILWFAAGFLILQCSVVCYMR